MRRFVSAETSALFNSGMTTEACMLKASAVDGARYRFDQPTFAGARVNGRGAPIPAIRVIPTGRTG
jgi:hypothetical protein